MSSRKCERCKKTSKSVVCLVVVGTLSSFAFRNGNHTMDVVTNSYETLERGLRRLSIVILDEQQDLRRGMPGPLVALMRKLLFQTSVAIMKTMLLRGCASHVSDKKVVIAVFDLLREEMKFSPACSIDQFFSPVSPCGRVVFLSISLTDSCRFVTFM
jgi:hypothetical protein